MNIFDSEMEALVNPVNCVGVMGAGLAKQFRERFPENYEIYRSYCNREILKPGFCFAVLENGKWIINFPTKNHWKDKSKIEWVEEGLLFVKNNFPFSIAFPKLGCGLGGLNWWEVKPLIEKYMENRKYEICE